MDESKQEIWRKRIEDFRTSGLTQRQYASDLGVRIRTLQYWNTKYGQATEHSSEIRWMEVKAAEASRKTAGILLEIDGVRIAVTEDYSPTLLKSVIQILKES